MPIKTTDTAKAEELQKSGLKVLSLKGINPTEVTFETAEEAKTRIAEEVAAKAKKAIEDKKSHDASVKAREDAAAAAAKEEERAAKAAKK